MLANDPPTGQDHRTDLDGARRTEVVPVRGGNRRGAPLTSTAGRWASGSARPPGARGGARPAAQDAGAGRTARTGDSDQRQPALPGVGRPVRQRPHRDSEAPEPGREGGTVAPACGRRLERPCARRRCGRDRGDRRGRAGTHRLRRQGRRGERIAVGARRSLYSLGGTIRRNGRRANTRAPLRTALPGAELRSAAAWSAARNPTLPSSDSCCSPPPSW